ncbi:MAG: PilT/PilU family type 4a pilus ATPase [Vicinamibacteria bacterium]|nr:PilT/PilU family type 4a pilus ATPase [Vicinamibacteria bacterium]
MSQVNLHQILTFAASNKVSDIHLQVGSTPMVRRNGELIGVRHASLTEDDLIFICQHLCGIASVEEFKKTVREFDGSFMIPGVSRFRVNVFKQRGKYAAVLRVVPLEVLDFTALNLPPVMERIAKLQRGLILVTGATGNGKSTTLASIIHSINTHRRAHIVTIEDPIEFIYENKMSIISQREIGADTDNFRDALRAVLRQDPDVIMIGELRDHETVDIALKAAETGHLVLASVHTQDATRTVGRLLGYFPPEEQETIRQRVAENLMATISLRLLASKDGNGLVPAIEAMLVTRTIAECIRLAGKTNEIPDHIARNRDLGMQTFNQSLVDLVRSSKITIETAKVASTHPEELERDLTIE